MGNNMAKIRKRCRGKMTPEVEGQSQEGRWWAHRRMGRRGWPGAEKDERGHETLPTKFL